MCTVLLCLAGNRIKESYAYVICRARRRNGRVGVPSTGMAFASPSLAAESGVVARHTDQDLSL